MSAHPKETSLYSIVKGNSTFEFCNDCHCGWEYKAGNGYIQCTLIGYPRCRFCQNKAKLLGPDGQAPKPFAFEASVQSNLDPGFKMSEYLPLARNTGFAGRVVYNVDDDFECIDLTY